MLKFFKNKENTKENFFSRIAALLIYAAKIDEVYSKEEELIIKKNFIGFRSKKIRN